MFMLVEKPKTWQKGHRGYGKYTRNERFEDFARKGQDTKSEETTFTPFLEHLKGKGAIILQKRRKENSAARKSKSED